MGTILYLLNYASSCVIFILFICWIFYLAKAIKYRKSSCEDFEAEIKSFKGNTTGQKNIYIYGYMVDNINYFGEMKTSEMYNVGDKVGILYKRRNRSESITKIDYKKLPTRILIFFITWIVCNILYALSVYGQYLFYNM